MNGFEPTAGSPLMETVVAGVAGLRHPLVARRAAGPADAAKDQTGALPAVQICSCCKKVRNDENYWEQIERYVSERSHAQFSHGICPDCRDGVVRDQLER